jgi:hypothetical protein
VKPSTPLRLCAPALLAFLALGCGGGHGPASLPRTPATVESTSTAEGTVVAYYSRLGRHDAVGAADLLAPALRQEALTAGPDGDLTNTVSVSNIRDVRSMAAPSTQGLPSGYREVTQVFLTYDAVYRHVVAAGNGPNSRFVYVGRDAAGQWRILEIGTGP